MKETEYYSEKKKGLIGTIVFHTILLLLLIFLGFFTPLPLPGEEGILVNFGDSETGLGQSEPAPARRQQNTQAAVQPQKSEPTPSTPKSSTPPPAPPKSQPKEAEQAAMTQDYEKTAAIDAAEKKKRDEEVKKQQELAEARRKQQADSDAKAKADADAKKKAEAEAKAKADAEARKKAEAEAKAKAAEAERQRLAEIERKQKEEEQRKINEINSRTQGAFANNGGGSGGTGSGTGKSQGVTFPGGNQGVATGDPNAANYGDGGSGSGNQGSGISFSLSGRSAISLPKPQYPGNDAGVVVVKVTVDKNGRVTSAEPGVRGTTIMDKQFWNEAKQAALKARFNLSESAPAFQQGTISYRFVLD